MGIQPNPVNSSTLKNILSNKNKKDEGNCCSRIDRNFPSSWCPGYLCVAGLEVACSVSMHQSFSGTEYASTGDPDILCNRLPGLCYVSCNSDCRDQDTAAGANRCQSSLACQAYLGGDSLPCRGGPPKLKKTVGR